MKQRDAFLDGEGQAWYERNKDKLGQSDPVCDVIEELGLKPTSVLEVGCADGWRLKKLKAKYGCVVTGIEPALLEEIEYEDGEIARGTADELVWTSKNEFDLVIYGFCLYLCDPEDYFRIAAEGDRVLKDGGHIIIHDFKPRMGKGLKIPYRHKPGLFSHHYDFKRLWLCHPAYRWVTDKFPVDEEDDQYVVVLKKDINNAFVVGV